jgi:hypothetical protein
MRVYREKDCETGDGDGTGTEGGAVDRETDKGKGGIEATNNPAELTIRQSILDRIVTQGSRECIYDIYPAKHFGNELSERMFIHILWHEAVL